MKRVIPFRWADFCLHHGLEPKERGKSTAKGHIYISCPWCLDGANHQHMGLSLTSTFYGCWKDPSHRGINPARLIRSVLDVSWAAAQQQALRYAPSGLDFWAAEEVAPVARPNTFAMPDYITDQFAAAAVTYLNNRGVSLGDFYALGGRYGSSSGQNELAWRVTLPVETPQLEVVGVTGRHVGTSSLRYLTLPKGGAAGLVGCSWREDTSSLLAVVEGPFDAVKLQIAARTAKLPVDVVAILGEAGAAERLHYVRQLSRQYEHTAFVLDDASYAGSVKFAQDMPGPASAHLCGAKDPGSLTNKRAQEFLREVLESAEVGR